MPSFVASLVNACQCLWASRQSVDEVRCTKPSCGRLPTPAATRALNNNNQCNDCDAFYSTFGGAFLLSAVTACVSCFILKRLLASLLFLIMSHLCLVVCAALDSCVALLQSLDSPCLPWSLLVHCACFSWLFMSCFVVFLLLLLFLFFKKKQIQLTQ